ncbi:MAG: segregation/condensation protein A [Oscillospiraceae bacterium]|nr:segregation/condensation protein A [Oscillospiraceae bacterium]
MENPSFHLEGVIKDKDRLEDFEGPLNLILMLLSKNKIEIRDIRISDILDQYLEYLAQMESMDLEIASEFIQMASHLLYIKTRTLLTTEEEVSELELLIASLEQLKNKELFSCLQAVTPQFKEMSEKGMLYFAKLPEPVRPEMSEYKFSHEPVDLLKSLQAMYLRGIKTPEEIELDKYIPQKISFSVQNKSRQILKILTEGRKALKSLYAQCRTSSELVATFISILELCSMGSITVNRLNDDYELEFVGGDVEEIVEKIVE